MGSEGTRRLGGWDGGTREGGAGRKNHRRKSVPGIVTVRLQQAAAGEAGPEGPGAVGGGLSNTASPVARAERANRAGVKSQHGSVSPAQPRASSLTSVSLKLLPRQCR